MTIINNDSKSFLGRPLSVIPPANGQAYVYENGQFIPTTVGGGGGGAVTGDLSGTVPGAITVIGFEGRPLVATAPSVGQGYVWDGTDFVPQTVGKVAFAPIDVVTLGLVPPPGNNAIDYGPYISSALQTVYTELGSPVIGLLPGNYYINTQILINLNYMGIVGTTPVFVPHGNGDEVRFVSTLTDTPSILVSSGVAGQAMENNLLKNFAITTSEPIVSGLVAIQTYAAVAPIIEDLEIQNFQKAIACDVDPLVTSGTNIGSYQGTIRRIAINSPALTTAVTTYGIAMGEGIAGLTIQCDVHHFRIADISHKFASNTGGGTEYGIGLGLADSIIIDGFQSTNQSAALGTIGGLFDYSKSSAFAGGAAGCFPSDNTFRHASINLLGANPTTAFTNVGAPGAYAYANRSIDPVMENGVPPLSVLANFISPTNEPGPNVITDASTTALAAVVVGASPYTWTNPQFYAVDLYITANDTGTTVTTVNMAVGGTPVVIANGTTLVVRVPALQHVKIAYTTTAPAVHPAYGGI